MTVVPAQKTTLSNLSRRLCADLVLANASFATDFAWSAVVLASLMLSIFSSSLAIVTRISVMIESFWTIPHLRFCIKKERPMWTFLVDNSYIRLKISLQFLQ